MGAGMPAPLHCRILLCEDVSIPHLILGFRLKHIDGVVSLGHEVWLILRVIGAGLIENLELAFGRFEPLLRFALQNNSHNALRFGMELLHRKKAPREVAKQIPGHIALIWRRLTKIQRWLLGGGRVGTLLQIGEPFADDHLVIHIFFPVVLLHLDMNELGDFTLV